MSVSRFAVLLVAVGGLLGGCAKAPEQRSLDVRGMPAAMAYQAVDATIQTASMRAPSMSDLDQKMPAEISPQGSLAGRTLTVASVPDIMLRSGEVILTFDDGPRPGKTDRILETLDRFGVGATFMMLGRAAERHPELVQQVALAGHTIGTHTYDHANLTDMPSAAAMQEIAAGEGAIAGALAPIGRVPSPFFRFPYLAQTGFLRTSLTQTNVIVLDVDVDSKDYYDDTPETVIQRTLARLDARGSGIILFHDIHARTVALLPEFLSELEKRGYSVVRLKAREPGVFGREVITAGLPD